MTWFPCNNHPTDKATFSFYISVSEPYVVAANGILQDEIEDEDRTTYIFEASDPMATYLAAVNVAEFQLIIDEGPEGLPIHNYFPPDAPQRVISEFETVPDMIAFYSEIFGPYPFESIGVVVIPDSRYSGAIENQTLITFGLNAVGEEIIAHELVHQWFGDSVSVATWQDMWMSEGFATYGAALWLEHSQGHGAFEQTMASYYDALSFTTHPPPTDPTPEDIFGITVYYRGALALHALRLEVGDEAFFDILATYYDRYQYGYASTADFMAVAEAVSGRDLGELFQAWLFDAELPPMPA
jgi:aminopeptidase N